MNDKERAAMQQALEAIGDCSPNKALVKAAYALREALAEQAEQEPMYISESCAERGCACHYSVEVDGEPVTVYSAPVRTKDLTDEDIQKLRHKIDWTAEWSYVSFARAVIAADREKNK